MNESPLGRNWSPLELAFLQKFFGPGNVIGHGVDTPSDENLGPLLEELRTPRANRLPVVLPRRVPGDENLISYVITWTPAQARQVSEVITAFVGYSVSHFNGKPTRLDSSDPPEQAILQLAGPNLTFKIQSGQNSAAASRAWNLLMLMLTTMRQRPRASLSFHHRSVARLLEDFDLSLAAGDITSAGRCLNHITLSGGLTDANLTRLRARLLVQQGRDDDLLNLAGLRRVVADGAPEWLRDALLASMYRSADPHPHLDAGDLEEAWAGICDHSRNLPLANLLAGAPETLGAEALSVWTLNAILKEDRTSLRQLISNRELVSRLSSSSPSLVELVQSLPSIKDDVPEQPAEGHTAAPASIDNWLNLMRLVADGDQEAESTLRDRDTWSTWDPPVVHDSEIADFLLGLDNVRADKIWCVVGPFVEADDYREPAWRSAREFLRNALINDRFTPADLAGIVALTEIMLRGAPDVEDYSALLNDLGAEAQRWVSPDRATVALDLADLLARSASPDPEARLRLAIALLQPLSAHQKRLKPEERSFARRLSTELRTDLSWPEDPADAAGPHVDLRALTMLLYSLDEAVLNRTEDALKPMAPNVKVVKSANRVNSDQLRQHAHNADIIVLATRCAKHAATGAIRENAGNDKVIMTADGSGSASLLRAAVEALQRCAKGRH
ncbi:protein DpdD [Thermopolyspora sp. NPDC052614]|uniref:protein DpdD n=1 Tax=Thermopolyspora sp. NPDC052614 TaxID=3155682 RepID=UPI0034300E88